MKKREKGKAWFVEEITGKNSQSDDQGCALIQKVPRVSYKINSNKTPTHTIIKGVIYKEKDY